VEPKGSIPNSQELSTCPYPEPYHSSPHHPIPPLQDPFQYYYSPTYSLVFLTVSILLAFNQQRTRVPRLPHSFCMPRSSHPPWLHYSNYTWRRVQIMKLFVMQFSPSTCRLWYCGVFFHNVGFSYSFLETRLSLVGWSTIVLAGRSRVWFPIKALDFFQFAKLFKPHIDPGVETPA
jgi:hypothetical protein